MRRVYQNFFIVLAAVITISLMDRMASAGFEDQDQAFQAVTSATDNLVGAQSALSAVADRPESSTQRADLTRQIDQQKSAVEAAAAQFKDSAKVQTAAANFSVMAGDNAKALAHADAAVQAAEKHMTNPRGLADALQARALAAAAGGDSARALADAKQVLKMYPDDEGAMLIAQMADRSGRDIPGSLTLNGKSVAPQNSVKGKSTGVVPGRPDGRGGSARGAGAGGQTVKIDESVGAVDWPRVAQSIMVHKKAIEDLKKGDYPAMHAHAAQATELFPMNANALRAASFASAMMGHNQDALAEANAGLVLKPDAPQFLSLRARIYNQMVRPGEALADAGRAVALDPKNADGWLQKGLARKGLGEPPDKYLEDLKRAVAEDPSLQPILTSEMQSALAGGGGATRAGNFSAPAWLRPLLKPLERQLSGLPQAEAEKILTGAGVAVVALIWGLALIVLVVAVRRRRSPA